MPENLRGVFFDSHCRVCYASVTKYNTLHTVMKRNTYTHFMTACSDRRCVLPGTCVW